jgi:hypothetical protein
MDSALGALPDDIDGLKAALIAERGERIAEAAPAAAEAEPPLNAIMRHHPANRDGQPRKESARYQP